MTANRRIFLNIVATYGRSLYALVLGLFTARWAIEALGKVDYGLFGLVGGMVFMVKFINSLLATSVGRFYAVSIGEAKKVGKAVEGLETCRKWFNTAMSIHTIIPLILLAVGYPLGVWAVRNFLTIPFDRIQDCVLVWRCSCITCFVAMVNVPFAAMYTARQEIAEYTLFSLFTTTGIAILLYYMVVHPGVWLSRYAIGVCLFTTITDIALGIRAYLRFPECKLVRKYWFNAERYKQLGKFAFARFWSDFSQIFSSQGRAILVNKFMGPAFNASMTVGSSVASHTATLSSALSGAFVPAIGNLCGEGKTEEMRRFAFLTCRIGTVLMLIFAVPVALEINELLHLWLVNPPEFAGIICVAILASMIFDRMTDGYWMSIYSKGQNVVRYSWTVGWCGILNVLVSAILFYYGWGMCSIVVGMLVGRVLVVLIRLFYGKSLVGFEVSYWLRRVFAPIAMATIFSLLAGGVSVYIFLPSFLRIIITATICEIVFVPLAWLMIFEQRERDFVKSRLFRFFSSLKK